MMAWLHQFGVGRYHFRLMPTPACTCQDRSVADNRRATRSQVTSPHEERNALATGYAHLGRLPGIRRQWCNVSLAQLSWTLQANSNMCLEELSAEGREVDPLGKLHRR